MTIRNPLTLTAAILLSSGATSALAADDASSLNQSAWFRLGGFHPSINSRAQVDHPSSGAAGTDIDFEELGLSSKKTLPFLLAGARFAGPWRAEFEYFQLRRDGSVTLGQLLNFDDTTFPVQATLNTRFRSDIYRASVGYSFVKTPELELGAVVGAHVTTFDIHLDASVSAGGAPIAAQSEQQKRTVPLPTLGLYGAYAFAPHWETTARADIFSLKRGNYDGRLINAQVNVIYRTTGNVGVGLGYRYDDYRLIATKNDFRGRVEYKFNGPQAFVEVGF